MTPRIIMPFNVDNCTSISANSTSNTAGSTQYGILCLFGLYIMEVVICIFILPVNIWVLWLINKRATTRKGSAYTDLLHLNLIFTSVIFCIGFILNNVCVLYISNTNLYLVLAYIRRISLMAQTQFHTWICVEHYLAVVHPIYFLKL